jgi:hypothetical protein
LPGEASEMFLREGLDDPNQLEIAAQIKVCAQRIFRPIHITNDAERGANQLYRPIPKLPLAHRSLQLGVEFRIALSASI